MSPETIQLTKEIITAVILITGLLIFSIFTLRATFNAPFVPTPMRGVEKILAAAKLKKGARIYDIGCGDGRLIYTAERKYSAQATGFELSPLVYLIAKIRKIFQRSKAELIFGDFRDHNLSDAECIFCYMMPKSLEVYTKKFEKELRPGTKIISYAFHITNWKEVEKIPKVPLENIAPIWIYEIGKQ